METKYTYNDLKNIIAILRSEKGCPWDREQTHESLKMSLLEESYELVEAIENKDTENMKEELGDVLLQVLLHAQIASEAKVFDLEEVVDTLAKKMIYRHPHVFKEGGNLQTSEEVNKSWDELKQKEKRYLSTGEEIDKIPHALPALMRTQKVQKKVAKVGFNPSNSKDIMQMITDELKEVEIELNSQNLGALEEEIGDLLLSIVNLSAFFQINAEFALTKALEKFINRFRYIENWAFAKEKKLSQLTSDELDQLWKEAKKQ
jgi:tetrapyrrole methylase family protein/MazG family protein